MYAVVEHADPKTDKVERQVRDLRWGLVPNWAKDPKIDNRLINARVETLADIISGQPGESPIQPGLSISGT